MYGKDGWVSENGVLGFGWRAVAGGSDGKLRLRAKVEKAELMVTEGWGGGLNERVTSRNMGASVLGWGSYRVSDVSLRGEQLDWGAATLPTLSSLSRINDGVRIHECAGLLVAHTHTHTCTRSHRLTQSPCLIYTDMLSPCYATFTLNNVEGRDGCFWFPTRGWHLNGRRLNTPWSRLFKDPSGPCRPLVSL